MAAGWHYGDGSQSGTRVVRLVKAIYIMYKLWLISPLGWQRPRRAQVPWPGGRGTRREGQVVQHLLGTQGGRGGSADGASRYKNVERIL